MSTVRFNHWEEFVEETSAHPPDGLVVRLTFSARYDEERIAHLSMVAGYQAGNHIVEFVEYLGTQPDDAESGEAIRLRDLFRQRRALLEDRGFRVLAGRYRPSTAGD